MKRKLDGLMRLTRIKEYLFFVMITTFLGALAGGGQFGWRLVGVLLANWLAVAFAFMINDVEDADDDALTPSKLARNPVSNADLSPRAAYIASFVTAGLSMILFLELGQWPAVMGFLTLGLGFFYSWRRVRLKNMPFIDMLSHCLMLAGLQFLAGMFTFGPPTDWKWVFPFTFMVGISLYGELFNELRDLEGDLKAGLKHTASLLGARITSVLMMACLILGVGSGIMTLFFIGMIPLWVTLLMGGLAAILVVPPLLRARLGVSVTELQEPFQKPLEIAAAFALLIYLAYPWALTRLG